MIFFKDSTEIIIKKQNHYRCRKTLFIVAKRPSKPLQRGKMHGLKSFERWLQHLKIHIQKSLTLKINFKIYFKNYKSFELYSISI